MSDVENAVQNIEALFCKIGMTYPPFHHGDVEQKPFYGTVKYIGAELDRAAALHTKAMDELKKNIVVIVDTIHCINAESINVSAFNKMKTKLYKLKQLIKG